MQRDPTARADVSYKEQSQRVFNQPIKSQPALYEVEQTSFVKTKMTSTKQRLVANTSTKTLVARTDFVVEFVPVGKETEGGGAEQTFSQTQSFADKLNFAQTVFPEYFACQALERIDSSVIQDLERKLLTGYIAAQQSKTVEHLKWLVKEFGMNCSSLTAK